MEKEPEGKGKDRILPEVIGRWVASLTALLLLCGVAFLALLGLCGVTWAADRLKAIIEKLHSNWIGGLFLLIPLLYWKLITVLEAGPKGLRFQETEAPEKMTAGEREKEE